MLRGLHNPMVEVSDLWAVTAVPAHPSKQDVDLPDLLASAIGEELSASYRNDLVRKVRQTPEAKRLPDDRRREAVENAYEAQREVRGHVLLVDDLLYSGRQWVKLLASCVVSEQTV